MAHLEDQITIGDPLLLRAFERHLNSQLVANYKAPSRAPDHFHITLYLGDWDAAKTEYALDLDERLNMIGWVYDPERANLEIEAKQLAVASNMDWGILPDQPDAACSGFPQGCKQFWRDAARPQTDEAAS